MSDEARKVLGETWQLGQSPEGHGDIVCAPGGRGWGYFDHDSEFNTGEEKRSVSEAVDARARIAACAPEALRLLVEAEWKAVYQDMYTCLFCLAFKDDGHKASCKLVALLKKAGVRE